MLTNFSRCTPRRTNSRTHSPETECLRPTYRWRAGT